MGGSGRNPSKQRGCLCKGPEVAACWGRGRDVLEKQKVRAAVKGLSLEE